MSAKNFPFKKRENPMDMTTQTQARQSPSGREKYTATMDGELRKKVKIASVKMGIVFSQFIEEAVIEKLKKEGF